MSGSPLTLVCCPVDTGAVPLRRRYTGLGVGKAITLGGLGFWWLADLILLVTGMLTPADGSHWEPRY